MNKIRYFKKSVFLNVLFICDEQHTAHMCLCTHHTWVCYKEWLSISFFTKLCLLAIKMCFRLPDWLKSRGGCKFFLCSLCAVNLQIYKLRNNKHDIFFKSYSLILFVCGYKVVKHLTQTQKNRKHIQWTYWTSHTQTVQSPMFFPGFSSHTHINKHPDSSTESSHCPVKDKKISQRSIHS